jgi:hypothetical protein
VRLEDEFRDLAPLDPSADTARWERMVAGITMAAAPELKRRAAMPDLGLLQLLAGYARPAVSAAALMAAAAGAVFFASGGPAASTDAAQPSQTQVADGLGYPAPMAPWLASDQAPSSGEMLTIMQGGEQ